MSTASLRRTWDLTSYFPTLEGPEHRAFTTALRKETAAALVRTTQLAALPATIAGDDNRPGLREWAAVFAAFLSRCRRWRKSSWRGECETGVWHDHGGGGSEPAISRLQT